MDYLVLHYRNILVMVLLISSVSLLPDTALALTRPFLVLWLRIKRYRQSFLAKPSKENSNKFWVIDMTKLEP